MYMTPRFGRASTARGLSRSAPPRTLRDEMEDFFSRVFAEPRMAYTPTSALSSMDGGSYPMIDLDETDDQIRVTAELPGIDPDDIELRITGDVLTIEGRREEKREEGEGERRYSERFYGEFSRTVQLPETVDPDKVEAEYRDGELVITAPKTERTLSRKVAVKSVK